MSRESLTYIYRIEGWLLIVIRVVCVKINGMLKEWLNINDEISKGCVRSPWVFVYR